MRLRRAQISAAMSGALSAGLFVCVFGFGFGMPLCVGLPVLPLFLTVLAQGFRPLLAAALTGTALALLLADAQGALVYAGFVAAPALLLAPAGLRQARPMGLALTDLTLYAVLATIGLIVHMIPLGGLEPVIAQGLREGFEHEDPALQAAVDQLAHSWAFMVAGASAWLWMLLMYVHLLLAAWILRARAGMALPSLTLAPFFLPMWLLAALTACAAGSFSGDPALAFAAKILFVIFLFPYFLLGASWVHAWVRLWPYRTLALFFLYFFTLSQGWPALILACIGVIQQVKALTRHSPV